MCGNRHAPRRRNLRTSGYFKQLSEPDREQPAPVSAAVLLALAEKFSVSMSDLSSGEGTGFSPLSRRPCPILSSRAIPAACKTEAGDTECTGHCPCADCSPSGLSPFQRTTGQHDDRLVVRRSAKPPPMMRVRDYFHFVDNYIHDLDVMAERLAGEIGLGGGGKSRRTSAFPAQSFGVRVNEPR